MIDFGLREEVLAMVKGVLSENEKITRAVIFGSRAKGEHRKYSDVDICLYGDLSFGDVAKVKEALDEADIIYEFDVVAYDVVKSEALREHIDRVGVEVYGRE